MVNLSADLRRCRSAAVTLGPSSVCKQTGAMQHGGTYVFEVPIGADQVADTRLPRVGRSVQASLNEAPGIVYILSRCFRSVFGAILSLCAVRVMFPPKSSKTCFR